MKTYLALLVVIWTQYFADTHLVAMQCRGFPCIQLSSWELGLLDYSIWVHFKNPDEFICMALRKGSETLSWFLTGKGGSKVHGTILDLFKINIYENPVETKVDLVLRNLSAWVIIQNQARHFWQDSGGRCASPQLLQCSQRAALGNYWKIMSLNYTITERNEKHMKVIWKT